MDINELIATAYLQYVQQCDVVDTQVYIGERSDGIDVVGVDSQDWTVYVCEVDDHLISTRYSLAGRHVNHVDRYVRKFRDIAAYVDHRYEGFNKRYMLWVPVVTEHGREFVRNPMQDLSEIVTMIKIESGIDVDVIANERFAQALKQVRQALGNTPKILQSPILRFIQLEEQLNRHVANQPAARITEMPKARTEPVQPQSNIVAFGSDNE